MENKNNNNNNNNNKNQSENLVEVKGLAEEKNLAELKDYIRALGYLHGAIRLQKVLDVFAEQTGLTAESAWVRELIDTDETIQHLYREGDWIAHETVLMFDLLADLKIRKQWYPMWIPEREVLLRYADRHYFEWTPQALALLDHLNQFYREEGDLDAHMEDIVADIILDFQNEYTVDDVRRHLAGFLGLEELGEDVERRFRELLTELRSHTRTWQSNGYPLIEFQDIQTKYGPLPQVMGRDEPAMEEDRPIGRNDPCPCGSGKKYKKCCMRKETHQQDPSEGSSE